MKKFFILIWWSICLSIPVRGQEGSTAIGVHFAGLDFYGPQTGNYLLQQTSPKQKLFWDPAIRFSVQRSYAKQIDFTFAVLLSSLVMPASKNDTAYLVSKQSSSKVKQQIGFLSMDAGMLYSFLPKGKFICTPQAAMGVGYYFHKMNNGVHAYAGLGLHIHISRNLNAGLQSTYHYSVTNRYQTYLQHAIGLLYSFGKPATTHVKQLKRNSESEIEHTQVQATAALKESVSQDTDNDGIPDDQDNCITEPGRKETSGCPDKDRDGVADKQDLCPDVKGSKSARGCPDADGDGVADATDQCPEVFGKGPEGCPLPEDIEPAKSSNTDTIASENAAVTEKVEEPENLKTATEKVGAAAAQIQFNSGTAYIHPSSYSALDTIVAVLKKDHLLHVDIEGHTDNTGGEKQNLLLSQQRADACKDYLIKAGIDEKRISAIGYGDMNPIADNTTEAGRKANRRTAFLLFIPGP